MAAGEAPKHLLSLLRDFASEKSQGERRVAGLKKRISELQPELESANLQLEDVKRRKEAAEHHVRGLEVELACAEALLQARQARLSSQQDAMSSIRAEFEALKKGEDLAREDFLNQMFEFNKRIRESHRPAVLRGDSEVSSTEGNGIAVCNDSMNTSVDIQHLTKSHENALTCLMDEISIKQGAYQEDQAVQKKILQELAQQEKRILLIEAVAKESEELQAVSMQTAELEKVYTSLGDKLQTKFRCPRCNLDNIGQLGETFGGA
ncbi:uncharacterized protein LOC18429790 isoform X5 [Amborella trichopoda]|uniref:uncharacterized protein LOC18429790 isoform X5 n=1 Tax=Amborella trichopoda TaxID=13333 RepID=UPI0009C123D0|nr:uncharacterized protein LOC18429790 isoform X5 [Amborella trichopoda]|eukprot:XP_020520292.1 uncharacterized protein LOC18429790 isoform X5 [Amborella trichopoda]